MNEKLNKHEPPPQESTHLPVWDMVVADMKERDMEGRRKYGTPLRPLNGRNALIDAYQEALDLVVYLRQVIYEDQQERPYEIPGEYFDLAAIRNDLGLPTISLTYGIDSWEDDAELNHMIEAQIAEEWEREEESPAPPDAPLGAPSGPVGPAPGPVGPAPDPVGDDYGPDQWDAGPARGEAIEPPETRQWYRELCRSQSIYRIKYLSEAVSYDEGEPWDTLGMMEALIAEHWESLEPAPIPPEITREYIYEFRFNDGSLLTVNGTGIADAVSKLMDFEAAHLCSSRIVGEVNTGFRRPE